VVIAVRRPEALGRDGLQTHVKEILARRGYQPYREADTRSYLIVSKNRIARWSSPIFHAGILAIIVAALYALAFQKRGFVQLVEADGFDASATAWRSKTLGVLARDFDPGFRMRAKTFTPSYWEAGNVKNMETLLVVAAERGATREVPVSLHAAADVGDVRVYQSEYFGVGVPFVLELAGREPISGNLLLDAPARRGEAFRGAAELGDAGVVLEAALHGAGDAPQVELALAGAGGVRHGARAAPGERVALGEATVTLDRPRHWTGIRLAANFGLPGVYFGFALASLGAIMIFAISYKEIHVSLAERDGGVEVALGGRSKSDQAIFAEEFQSIAGDIRRIVG
jgi:cytochrome c biogenesis protein ResB